MTLTFTLPVDTQGTSYLRIDPASLDEDTFITGVVTPVEPGAYVNQGEKLVVVSITTKYCVGDVCEYRRSTQDIHASHPVRVVAVNETVQQDPILIIEDPLNEGWLIACESQVGSSSKGEGEQYDITA